MVSTETEKYIQKNYSEKDAEKIRKVLGKINDIALNSELVKYCNNDNSRQDIINMFMSNVVQYINLSLPNWDKLKTVNDFISDTDNFKFSGEFEVYNMITEKPFYDIWTSEMANEIIDYYLNNC